MARFRTCRLNADVAHPRDTSGPARIRAQRTIALRSRLCHRLFSSGHEAATTSALSMYAPCFGALQDHEPGRQSVDLDQEGAALAPGRAHPAATAVPLRADELMHERGGGMRAPDAEIGMPRLQGRFRSVKLTRFSVRSSSAAGPPPATEPNASLTSHSADCQKRTRQRV